MKRPALQNKQVVVLRMAFRARKVIGTFEKRAPDLFQQWRSNFSFYSYPIEKRSLTPSVSEGFPIDE